MSTPRRPPGRYDEKRPLPKPVLLTGAVVLGLLLLGFAYLGFSRFSGGRVQFGTVAYEVLDARSVRVRFQVDKALTDTVRCGLEARDRGNNVVGRLTVDVGPSDRGTVLTEKVITTTSRAATGEVLNCTVVTAGTPGP